MNGRMNLGTALIMATRVSTAALLLVAVTGARAAIIAYDASSSLGNPAGNPTAQGWIRTAGTGSESRGFEGGIAYWEINHTPPGNSLRYTYTASASDYTDPSGWTHTITLKILSSIFHPTDLGPSAGISFSLNTGSYAWALAFRTTTQGSYDTGLYAFSSGGYNTRLTTSVDTANYHTYQMVYDPDISAVRFYLDGTLLGTQGRVNPSVSTLTTWGNPASGGTGHARFNRVLVETGQHALVPILATDPGDQGTLFLGDSSGNVRLGTSGSGLLSAANDGAFNLSGNFATPTDPRFTLVGGVQGFGLLGPGQSDNRTYTFTPTARGTVTETLTITSNGGTLNDQTAQVTLSGTGVGPEFAAAAPELSGGTIDFGTLTGDGFVDVSLTLRNDTPDADLGTLTGLSILNWYLADGTDFQIVSSLPSSYLTSDDTFVLHLRYAPTADGFHSDMLTIVTDQDAPFGASGTSFNFTLQGEMIPEPGCVALAIAGGMLLWWTRRRFSIFD